MAKVKKIDAPILVIGLGGTGFDALMRVKYDFANRFEPELFSDGSFSDRPARTEFLEIDTDASVKNIRKYGMTLRQDEFIDISGNLQAIHSAMKNKPYINEWVDPKISTLDVNANGAGACRQVSRLFLFNKIEQMITQIQGKLNVLNNVPAGAPDKSTVIQVKIIAGISGGTGSGTLLDTAYILKEIAATLPCRINMEAYLIMPDVTVAHVAAGDPVRSKIYHTNSYGLLKELDYWMNATDTGITLSQQYSDSRTITWKGIPFDDIHLLCAQNDQGIAIANAYEHNIQVISEYLVHCYESTDDFGNEDFDIVNSKDGGVANANNSFSFQSARSNQQAIVDQMNQPYPVPYRYHSLGAFSNAGENRIMELKEWNMIYDEAMVRIGKHPVQMGGVAPVEFQDIVLTFDIASPKPAGSVRVDYNKRHPIPSTTDAYDLNTLWNSDEVAAPSGSLYKTFSTRLMQSHGDEELKLTEAVWNVFITEATKIGEDIERGPAYLLDLLRKGENSITVRLGEFISKVENSLRNAESMRPNHEAQSHNKFRTFKDHRILGIPTKKPDLYNAYISEVNLLFDATRAAAYYNALLTALKNFQKSLQRYVAILSDLVTAISVQQKELQQELQKCDVSSTLFSIEEMTKNLTELFSDQERRDTFVKAMYGNTMNVALACMKDTIPADQLSEQLDKAIDALRENQFISVGGMTLTQKISAYQNITSGAAMQKYVETVLCPKLTSGANVMFNASTAAAGLPGNIAARTSLISVPVGEDDIADGIANYCAGMNMSVIIKRTPTSDRVFWVNDKGGMPMYFYSQLEILRNDYLALKNSHKGFHLFMGNTNALNEAGLPDVMKQNWADILPDPMITRNEREVGEKADQLKAAEEAGVLTIEYTYPVDGSNLPQVAFFRNLYNKVDGIAISETTIKNAIGAGVDAEEQKKLAPLPGNEDALKAKLTELSAYKAKLDALQASKTKFPLHISHLEHKAIAWGNIYSVHNRMIALSPSMDEATTAQIRDAWKMTYDRAIREALSWRPDLMAELNVHTACNAIIKERIAKVEADIAAIEGVLSAIEKPDSMDMETGVAKAAQLMMYHLVDVYPAQVTMQMDDEEFTVFDNSTNVDLLVNLYPEFKTMPILIRFAAWYAASGNKTPKGVVLTEKMEAIAKKMNKKKRVDDDVKEVFAAAQEAKADIKTAGKRINKLYLEEELSDEANAFFKKLVQAMTTEMDAFINTWEDQLEDDE